jgi:hypothetical protein
VERIDAPRPHRIVSRLIVLTLAGALVVAACTPQTSSKDTQVEDSQSTTTTASEPATDEEGNLLPPQREDPSDVAIDVLVPVEGFEETTSPPETVNDLLISIDDWLPQDLVAGDASAVYRGPDGSHVAVVSVIPELTWRGDPGFVPDLIEALTDGDPESPAPGVFKAEAPSGAVMHLWSSGDGFVVASSFDDEAAITYLTALEEQRSPNAAWATGDCLFLEETETLPYAPFPDDVVVSCNGAHNAEVLIGFTQGTDDEDFDAKAIESQRNFDCDEAYNTAFGDQLSHAPGLVTYMPDEDEWDRGDRYLACVVVIERNDGRQLFSGAMADLDDLDFNPETGACLLDGLPADTVDCSLPHAYQYLGDTTIDATTWPAADSAVFEEACLPLLDTLAAGPGTLDVFPIGLGPFAFENGDRTVRCMAFATVDGFLVDVLGGFDSAWRVLSTDGVAA